MRVTIKLILNAAAALLLLHAASGGYAASVPVTTGYYIRKDVKKADGTTEKNVCCSIALSVDKVQYTLTVPENSYSGYTAAYEDGNGNWQILKETDGQTEWKSVTDTSKKEKLAKLFAPVQNQNMEISAADGTAAELTSPGYIVQSESPALAAEVSGQAYKGIVLPSLSGGRFYLAEYGTGTTYLLTFRTAGSFMDLEAEALSKGRTRQQILNNMFSWLAAADKDKESSTDSVLSEKLAEMLAESLVKDDAFDGLYTTGGNEYIRGYVEKAFTNGRNIYADRLHNSDAQYNPKGYKAIDADESGKLADKAVEINSLKRGSRKKYETSAGGRALIADCIAQSGLSGVTGSPAFGRMLTDDDAFEELTEYIPELNEVRRGDIVTELVTNKNETKENIGIITKADGTGSTDGIDVVWLRNGRLYVETSTLSEFGKNPNTIRCRRLLKKTDSAGTYEQAENWDVLDRVPVSAELETGSMSEENQASSERWRWIPNTGEYLVLERLSVQLKNRSGMKLKPVTGSSYSVTLKGAYDRNYDSTKTDEGNIYNNKAASFDVAFLDGDNTVQCRGKLDNPEIKGKQKLYKFEKTEGTVPAMYADATGNIYTTSGKRVRLGIRPESAERAYPGDDLIPAFTVVYTNTVDGSIKSFDFQAKDSDYLAVYDKKLLWRANLYIEQTEPALGNMDWNNAHPWNVPPAAGTEQEEVRPVDWSAEWGYNEWNRKMTPESQFAGTAVVGLANLPAGNGGQVITLPQYTPLRTLPSGQVPGSNNILSKTVAYSYPQHDYEPVQNPVGPGENNQLSRQDGDSGSQDSPFDFEWKMNRQKALMAAAYDDQGKEKTQSSETAWNNTTAPDNTWKKYKKGSSGEPSFIPSLGLWYWEPGNGNNEEEVSASELSRAYIYEAGTDCIGMAQRAGSWMMKPGVYNSYAWRSLLPGMMEYGNEREGTTDPDQVYTGAAANKRQYPITENISTTLVEKSEIILNQNAENSKGKLAKIVPGDIFVKRKTETGSYTSHIAVVAYVPPDAAELSVDELMNRIILIEAEYNNKIQSVIKVLSVGDYNHNNLTKDIEFYKGFTLTKDQISFSLNCQSWAIRRLK